MSTESRHPETQATGPTIRWYHSVGSRLVMALGAVIILSTTLTLAWIGSSLKLLLLADGERELNQLSEVVLAGLKRQMLGQEKSATQLIIEDIAGTGRVTRVQIIAKDGRIVRSSVPGEIGGHIDHSDPTCRVCHDSTLSPTQRCVKLPGTGKSGVLRCVTPISNLETCHSCHGVENRMLGMLLVDRSLKEREDLVRSVEWKIASIGVATLAVLVGVVFLLAQGLVGTPVKQLTRGAGEIARGNLQARIGLARKDELGILASAFDVMAASLKQRIEEIRRKNSELTALYTIVRRLTATIHLPELKRVIVSAIGAVLEARWTILLTHLEKGPGLDVSRAESAGPTEEFLVEPPSTLKLPPGIALDLVDRWVAGELKGPALESNRSVARVPLALRGRSLGLLVVQKPEGQTFDAEDLPLLTTLGDNISVGFENARLYTLAITDELTGLFSLRHFQSQVEAHVSLYHRYGRPVSLLMADLDRFKQVNDTFGHPAGDRVLASVATALRHSLRAADIPCRYGGEEFAVILPEAGPQAAAEVAERIRSAVARAPIDLQGGCQAQVTISIGVASCPCDARRIGDLIAAADRALYRAKGAGRDCVRLAPASEEAAPT